MFYNRTKIHNRSHFCGIINTLFPKQHIVLPSFSLLFDRPLLSQNKDEASLYKLDQDSDNCAFPLTCGGNTVRGRQNVAADVNTEFLITEGQHVWTNWCRQWHCLWWFTSVAWLFISSIIALVGIVVLGWKIWHVLKDLKAKPQECESLLHILNRIKRRKITQRVWHHFSL